MADEAKKSVKIKRQKLNKLKVYLSGVGYIGGPDIDREDIGVMRSDPMDRAMKRIKSSATDSMRRTIKDELNLREATKVNVRMGARLSSKGKIANLGATMGKWVRVRVSDDGKIAPDGPLIALENLEARKQGNQ